MGETPAGSGPSPQSRLGTLGGGSPGRPLGSMRLGGLTEPLSRSGAAAHPTQPLGSSRLGGVGQAEGLHPEGAPRGFGRGSAPAAPLAAPAAAPRAPRASRGAGPAAPPGEAGADKPAEKRRGRPALQKEKAETAAEAVKAQVVDVDMDVDEDEEGEGERAEGAAAAPRVGALPSWVDLSRDYPTTLPFMAPVTREGAAAASPLEELGLLDGEPDGRLFLMQLPVRPPHPRCCPRLAPHAHACSQALLPMTATPGGACTSLEQLREGLCGQLQVHASGAVKLRIGGVLFDVLPGAPLSHCEQVAAVNCAHGRTAVLGTARGRLVLTPDLGSLGVGEGGQ